MSALVDRCCALTAELAQLVEDSPCLELVAPAPSCVCCFRFRPEGLTDPAVVDELNRRIQIEAAREGTVFFTGATLRNRFCLRAAIVNWQTTLADVQTLVDTVTRIGTELSQGKLGHVVEHTH